MHERCDSRLGMYCNACCNICVCVALSFILWFGIPLTLSLVFMYLCKGPAKGNKMYKQAHYGVDPSKRGN